MYKLVLNLHRVDANIIIGIVFIVGLLWRLKDFQDELLVIQR